MKIKLFDKFDKCEYDDGGRKYLYRDKKIFQVDKRLFKTPGELGLELPVLVLASTCDDRFNNRLNWQYVKKSYFFAGAELYIKAAVLQPIPEFKEFMKQYDESCMAVEGPLPTVYQLDQVQKYEEKLNEFGASCRRSYRSYADGVYPIDFEPEFLCDLTENDWPLEMIGNKKIFTTKKYGVDEMVRDLYDGNVSEDERKKLDENFEKLKSRPIFECAAFPTVLADYLLEKKREDVSRKIRDWNLFILGNTFYEKYL